MIQVINVYVVWNVLRHKSDRYKPSDLFDDETLPYLCDKYLRNKAAMNLDISRLYNSDYFNVAVHIRKGDVIREPEC